MHEKRRYGELVLHRVTAAMSNDAAKSAAADIRAEGYRARLDTWQGQFAVWSDKGLTDPTMPPRTRRSGGGGRRRGTSRRVSSIQAEYDKLIAANKSVYPLQKFKFDDRMWGWHGAAYSDAEKKRKEQAFVKQGYDVAWLSFKGSGIPLCYIAKWKDGKKPKFTPDEVARAVGTNREEVKGVITLPRSGKLVTYKGKKWKRFGCHIRVGEARDEANKLTDEFNVKIFTFKDRGLFCVYVRRKRQPSIDKTAAIEEVYTYLDKLHESGVDYNKFAQVLVQTRGMTPATAQRIVRSWENKRQIRSTPPTMPGRKRVSKGVYTTRSEAASKQQAPEREPPKGKPESTPRRRRSELLEPSFKSASQVSRILRINVDDVVFARTFDKKDLLVLVRKGKQYRIYEVTRNTRGPNKGKFGERKLIDKFSVRTPDEGVELAFRREASKRGIQV